MSELQYPEASKEYLIRKGIISLCAKHQIEYDPHIGCPECKQDRARNIFKNVVWLNEETCEN